MSQFSTKERILGAAERLFAQHGFAGASLRRVTAAANVNLAAVNYHFGSKENPVNEVFRRRLDELNQRRVDALEATAASRTLEGVLSAFIEPALAISLDNNHGGATFVRVLARAYAESNDRLRKFLSENYGHVTRRFVSALADLLPQLSREDLLWRLDFVAGSLTYIMAEFGTIKRPPGVDEQAHRATAANQLLRFATAGLTAP